MVNRSYLGRALVLTVPEKPRGICKGKVNVILDGEELPTNVIPPQGDGKEHTVRVIVH